MLRDHNKVSGHEIERLTLKIEKNVNKTEIDHIGAYLCGYKYPKSSVVELLYSFTNVYCENLCFKNGHCHFNEIGRYVNYVN